jgi:hypothetical protein
MAVLTQVAAQIVVVVPVTRIARSYGYYRPFMQWLLPGVVAALAVYLVIWLVRRRITRNLRQQLTERGLPTCMACGYDLTGNLSGVCPECGAACPADTPGITEPTDA